jgi:hypothetical protein
MTYGLNLKVYGFSTIKTLLTNHNECLGFVSVSSHY